MPYRPEYLEALTQLAEAADEVVAAGWDRPVLVGGGAVEWYTAGAIASGDFDIATAAQEALEAALIKRGWERPRHGSRGLKNVHLRIAFEVVSSSLLEGRADRTKVVMVDLAGHSIGVIGIEDIIADRMGQYNSTPRGEPEMRRQAVALYRVALAMETDLAYLDRRIRDETIGDYGLDDLSRMVEEAP